MRRPLYDKDTDTYYVPVAGDIIRRLNTDPMRCTLHVDPELGMVASDITDVLQSTILTYQRTEGRMA